MNGLKRNCERGSSVMNTRRGFKRERGYSGEREVA